MMKKFLVSILIVAILIVPTMAGDREQLYRRFGPMLVEALVMIIKDEINLIRQELGLSARTNQQLINAIENKLDSLDEYEWMQMEE